jgi:hypothetical protein
MLSTKTYPCQLPSREGGYTKSLSPVGEGKGEGVQKCFLFLFLATFFGEDPEF